jgi:lysophospholipid acyltransferase (LPLAT)-like uncharacterized protein
VNNEFSFGQRVALFFLSLMGPTLIKLYGMTWRIKWEGKENLEEAQKTSNKVLFCFWHSRLLGLCYTHRYWNIGIMVSKSFDGEWIARIVTHLGYRVFRGSASNAGAAALITMLRDKNQGHLALTVDGPHGPAEKVKPGALTLAARGRLPIVPISYVPAKAWRLHSWDRFILPKPFTTITVRYGKQIPVSQELDKNEIQLLTIAVEEGINRIS